MRKLLEIYYGNKVVVDASVASVVGFSFGNTYFTDLVDSALPYKKYLIWAASAGIAVGGFFITRQYFKTNQGNIIHSEGFNEISRDLVSLQMRLKDKFNTRKVAILQVQGLAELMPACEARRMLIESLKDLHKSLQIQSCHLSVLEKRLNDLSPSLTPIMFLSAIAQGYGYSVLARTGLDISALLLPSLKPFLTGENTFNAPFISLAVILLLVGGGWNLRKEYYFEKSKQFVDHYGEISFELKQIQDNLNTSEEEMCKALLGVKNYFSKLNISGLSPDEIYKLYLPLINVISSSGALSRSEFVSVFRLGIVDNLCQFLRLLSDDYRVNRRYQSAAQAEPLKEVIISGGLDFQLPTNGRSGDALPVFSINQFNEVDEGSGLLNPARRPRNCSISKFLFLLFKIPEGGYPVIAWLGMMNKSLLISLPVSAGVGLTFAGLKWLRCNQFEKLFSFNPGSVEQINSAINNHNNATLLNRSLIDEKISEVLNQFFSDNNLRCLSSVLLNSNEMIECFKPRRNREQFWRNFVTGKFQFDEEVENNVSSSCFVEVLEP